MSDGEGIRDDNDAISKTGKFARIEFEPRFDPERQKRKTIKSELSEENVASKTGIMRIFTVSEESSPTEDEDKPAE